MRYYDKIDLSKEIYVAKSNNGKECIIYHYLFFNHGFKFYNSVYNGWHDLKMLRLNISNIAIITVKGVECCCIIHDISKSKKISGKTFNIKF